MHFVDPAETAAVDLAEVDRFRLEELLEHDPIVAVLARRDADRCDRSSDRGVAKDVVGARGLLDPERLELGESLHALDRLSDVPDLIGVHHEATIQPISSRMIPPRRRSSSGLRPTFILNASNPSAIAARHSLRSLSSS